MTLTSDLLKAILPGEILGVQVGMSRTAVLAKTTEGLRCGLAATLSNDDFDHRCQPAVKDAGFLHLKSYRELAEMVDSPSFTESAIGLATINALLPAVRTGFSVLNGADYLRQNCRDKNVALIGHFPFIDQVKPLVKNLWVLELNPREGDLPASAAPDVLPKADFLALTATTIINKTFDGLLQLCRPDTRVIMIGPTTPLSPVMNAHGVHILSGTVVDDPQAVLLGIGQAASIHMLHQRGVVRYVTLVQE